MYCGNVLRNSRQFCGHHLNSTKLFHQSFLSYIIKNFKIHERLSCMHQNAFIEHCALSGGQNYSANYEVFQIKLTKSVCCVNQFVV